MYAEINPPQKRLDKKIINVMVMSDLIFKLILFIILGVLIFLWHRFEWLDWIGWTFIIIAAFFILAMIWTTVLRPRFLYKNWRYDLNKDFLQLKSGAFFEEHKLIPMTKIQSVETNQGPILRKYGLYSITVETIASAHEIPGLPKEIAMALREEIAHFAKVKEVE